MQKLDNVYEKHIIKNTFHQKKVRFITATEDTIDTYYKEDNDFIPFKTVMSEQYPKETSRKIKAVKIAKAKQGLFQGNTDPYGYKKVLIIEIN